ncbi:MAG: hypothetical protein JSV79_06635 [Armatimonadota bacterium]|nr:MAG: hypothetical protein JSV79_06635 [Armatimonadota bacterium]
MKRAPIGIGVAIAVGLAVLAFSTTAALGIDLGDVVKVGGIAFLVDQYDEQIDSFITSALGEREAAAKGATKVVPILSLGGGGYIGAAQVVGSPENVQRVKAVVQVEGKFGDFRAKVLVPTTTSKASGSPDRAKGVGVSAVIEFKI